MNLVVFKSRLKQRVQDVKAGLVGGEPGALFFHPAKSANGDMAIWLATPGTSPMFKPQQFLRSFLDEGFDGVLIAEPVASRAGVVAVLVE